MLPLLAILAVIAQAPAALPGTLAFTAPAGWKAKTPSSSMRVAEFDLPAGPQDPEPAELVVYYFGGSGGSVEANIQRWIGQFQQENGGDSSAVAKRASKTVNSLKVTLLDVGGTYVAEMRPGSTERHNKPSFRMLAAVVETPRGPYFVKLVGPARTVARWAGAYDEFIGTIRFEK